MAAWGESDCALDCGIEKAPNGAVCKYNETVLTFVIEVTSLLKNKKKIENGSIVKWAATHLRLSVFFNIFRSPVRRSKNKSTRERVDSRS